MNYHASYSHFMVAETASFKERRGGNSALFRAHFNRNWELGYSSVEEHQEWIDAIRGDHTLLRELSKK